MDFGSLAKNVSSSINPPTSHLSNIPYKAPITATAVTALVYAAILLGVTRTGAPKFNAHIKEVSRRRSANLLLTVHICLSLIEVVRWHIRARSTDLPHAESLDLVLCVVQSLTSFFLIKYTGRGISLMTRPSFQAISVLRLILTVSSWTMGNPALHKASIRGINAFIYARVLIIGSVVLQRADILPKMTFSSMYNLMSFIGFYMAFADGALPCGAIWFSLVVMSLVVLNHWVTKEAELKDLSFPRKAVRDSLMFLGFAELRVFKPAKDVQSVEENSKEEHVE